MHLSTLSEWLTWIASIHNADIELGLDRVKAVAAKLDLLTPTCPIVIVAGTNGKGSTVAGLEAIYLAAGYQVGAFTTPILFKHNEQVRINGLDASDEAYSKAFAAIEAVRGDISLTSFEFCTLAALVIFKTQDLAVLLLEVGLGGRLDAVNILDADVAVVTSIAIDHIEWLGGTRELIAREKAGILRRGRPAICGDTDCPTSLVDYAVSLGAPLFRQQLDFHYQEDETSWSWIYAHLHYEQLPLTPLATQNMATVLMAVTLLQQRLPVTRLAIDKGLSTVRLQGRIQVLPGPITEIYDVSHNPASIALLADRLRQLPCRGKTLAVFSMLEDKDIATSLSGIQDQITHWYISPLNTKRAASLATLLQAFSDRGINEISSFTSMQEAYLASRREATEGDRIIIFGSFHTVAEVWPIKEHQLL